ncbi:penicillin acylase family protein, partial [Streptomyces sp. L7]
MSDASLTDLRAEDVLPDLLKVVNSSTVTDTTAAAAVTKLQTWPTAGGKRTETSAGSKTYANSDAIRILDAWWPLLVKAEFQPGLGDSLYTAFSTNLYIDETPSAAHGLDRIARRQFLPVRLVELRRQGRAVGARGQTVPG